MSQINGNDANSGNRGFNFEEVEKIIGYTFENKNLLMQAFMRRSYGVECGAYAL